MAASYRARSVGARFGQFCITKGILRGAPRVAYLLAHGGSMPDRYLVRHRCENAACVNPAHLLAQEVVKNATRRDVHADAQSEKTPFASARPA